MSRCFTAAAELGTRLGLRYSCACDSGYCGAPITDTAVAEAPGWRRDSNWGTTTTTTYLSSFKIKHVPRFRRSRNSIRLGQPFRTAFSGEYISIGPNFSFPWNRSNLRTNQKKRTVTMANDLQYHRTLTNPTQSSFQAVRAKMPSVPGVPRSTDEIQRVRLPTLEKPI